MHDPLIRRLASNGKVKSAATRGPGFSWPGSAPQAGAFSGFQYLAPPEHADTEMKRHALEKASIATTQTPLPAPLWHDREDIIQRLCGLKQ